MRISRIRRLGRQPRSFERACDDERAATGVNTRRFNSGAQIPLECAPAALKNVCDILHGDVLVEDVAEKELLPASGTFQDRSVHEAPERVQTQAVVVHLTRFEPWEEHMRRTNTSQSAVTVGGRPLGRASNTVAVKLFVAGTHGREVSAEALPCVPGPGAPQAPPDGCNRQGGFTWKRRTGPEASPQLEKAMEVLRWTRPGASRPDAGGSHPVDHCCMGIRHVSNERKWEEPVSAPANKSKFSPCVKSETSTSSMIIHPQSTGVLTGECGPISRSRLSRIIIVKLL